ncbi:dihydropteroate synthase [Rhodobacteraceae bacterium XHP0102]|nr:dihydropteroate synthase [Rhodobacteraceae bacterium XHP0102]
MSAYYRPIPIIGSAQSQGALPLAGGWCHFTQVERLTRNGTREVLQAQELPDSWRADLTTPRGHFASVPMSRPSLMGILNLTPDSFSDGGRHNQGDAALAQARRMMAEGADILDLGAESTRPGAREIPSDEETARLLPIVAAIKDAAVVSVDTRKASVGRAALAAGARVVNDVSGLRFDPSMVDLLRETRAPVVLMHSLGTPETMQDLAPDAYQDVVLDIFDGLAAMRDAALAAGLTRDQILLDIGAGFGKTYPQTRALLRDISLFHGLGCGLLLGVSRKGFVGHVTGIAQADQRDAASAAIGLWAISQGVQMLRVHDIAVHHAMISAYMAASGLTLGEG